MDAKEYCIRTAILTAERKNRKFTPGAIRGECTGVITGASKPKTTAQWGLTSLNDLWEVSTKVVRTGSSVSCALNITHVRAFSMSFASYSGLT